MYILPDGRWSDQHGGGQDTRWTTYASKSFGPGVISVLWCFIVAWSVFFNILRIIIHKYPCEIQFFSPVPVECWEMIENATIFLCFLKPIQLKRSKPSFPCVSARACFRGRVDSVSWEHVGLHHSGLLHPPCGTSQRRDSVAAYPAGVGTLWCWHGLPGHLPPHAHLTHGHHTRYVLQPRVCTDYLRGILYGKLLFIFWKLMKKILLQVVKHVLWNLREKITSYRTGDLSCGVK